MAAEQLQEAHGILAAFLQKSHPDFATVTANLRLAQEELGGPQAEQRQRDEGNASRGTILLFADVDSRASIPIVWARRAA
jgi:hypothetical protein